MVLFKIAGGVIFVIGLSIFIGFPFFGVGPTGFQTAETSKTGILFGLMLMVVGALMAFFLN